MTPAHLSTERNISVAGVSASSVTTKVVAALLVSLGYYFGGKIGFALTFKPHPVSTLWPPNSILLAALLLSPTRWWWWLLLAVFPAHLIAELQAGVPPGMILSWFVSNCSEALIGATCIRALTDGPVRFDTLRRVFVFVACAVVLAPLTSSFLDSALVKINHFGDRSYWEVWRVRAFSNMLASLTLVPFIVTWVGNPEVPAAKPSFGRYLETAALIIAVPAIGVVAFGTEHVGPTTIPALLYAPLPILLWSTLRFGPKGFSLSFLAISFLAIWGAINGTGPFATQSADQNALSIQLFLIVVGVTLMSLTAIIRERELAQARARDDEARLELALTVAQMGTWDWNIAEDVARWSPETKRIFGFPLSARELKANEFYELVHEDDRQKVKNAIDRAINKGAPFEAEFRVPGRDDTVRWVRGKGKVLFDEHGEPQRMIGINADITPQKLVQDELSQIALRAHESDRRNRAILRGLPDLVFMLTKDGVYLDYHVSDPEELLVPPKVFLGKHVRDILPSDIADRTMECLSRASSTSEPQVLEYSLMLNDELKQFEARMTSLDDERVLAVIRDVTERHRASEALLLSEEKLRRSNNQIRALAARLFQIQEEERRRISRELHDDLSQKIATFSMAISRLKNKLPEIGKNEVREELELMHSHTDEISNTVRQLSHGLHPTVLEHLGLVAALESYVNEYRKEEQIEVSLTSDVGSERLPFEVSVCLYRVALEGLRNVARHSGAREAKLLLQQDGQFLRLEVSDTGRGFDVEAAARGTGLGLVSANERVRLLQGWLEISSAPNMGSSLVARVPFANGS